MYADVGSSRRCPMKSVFARGLMSLAPDWPTSLGRCDQSEFAGTVFMCLIVWRLTPSPSRWQRFSQSATQKCGMFFWSASDTHGLLITRTLRFLTRTRHRGVLGDY